MFAEREDITCMRTKKVRWKLFHNQCCHYHNGNPVSFHSVFSTICILMLFSGYSASAQDCPAPVLSKSEMCRCFHRPDYHNATYVPAPSGYILEMAEFDQSYAGDPYIDNSVCVFFGHGPNMPDKVTTYEFVIQAINEHGWPTGTWSIAKFRDVCLSPTSIRRSNLADDEFFGSHGCFQDALGFPEFLYTAPDRPPQPTNFIAVAPNLFQFFNPLVEKERGVAMLLRIDSADPDNRPTKLRFIAEAYFTTTTGGTNDTNQTLRTYSPTYSVTYPSPNQISLSPGSPDVTTSFDYAYQVLDYGQTPPMCLPPPPPVPPLPVYNETSCACIIKPRQQHVMRNPFNPSLPDIVHDRLLLPPIIYHWDVAINASDPQFDPATLTFYKNLAPPNEFTVNHTEFGHKDYLVVKYAFLPVYKDRLWRQREVIIHVMADNGLPLGRWLNPYNELEEVTYTQLCKDAFSAANLNWTKPPYPAVGKCVPYKDSTTPVPKYEEGDKACFFHFHSDYSFVNCVEHCEKPKYVCAVWTFDGSRDLNPVPFEFQIMANGIFYKNEPNNKSVVSVAPSLLPLACPTQPPPTDPLREWFWMETHTLNKGFSRRSDVWLFTGKTTQRFKRVDSSNADSDIVQDTLYFDSEVVKHPEMCVEPATYFLESKDNNLCLCTFWKENSNHWQTHYGRQTSCTHANSNPFAKHFQINFYNSASADRIVVRVSAVDPADLEKFFILHAVYIQAVDQYGIPVGKFDRGHWTAKPSPPAPADPPGTPCPNHIFPPDSNMIVTRYPIFTKKHCPKHTAIPDLKVEAPIDQAELYIYQNRWRDPYPEVCANFFLKGDRGHVTQIQFIAFLRIEDLKIGSKRRPSGHSYMLELRSGFLDADDLSVPEIPLLPAPPSQDPENRMLPLNYVYYNSTLIPNNYNWERECLVPVDEPPRLFQLCRHYVTIPNPKDQYKYDLDNIIDQYNQNCKLWIQAVGKYTISHPYSQDLRNNLDEMKQSVEDTKKIKACFTLKAFRHRSLNTLHVMFRVDGSDSMCDKYREKRVKEVAIVALNEEGYPIGRRWLRGEGSFKLFNHYDSLLNKTDFCDNDDIQLTLDDVIFQDRMVYDDVKGKCFYQTQSIFKPDPTGFRQDFATEDDVPSLFIWGNFQRDQNGFCAHWKFPTTSVPPPQYVQFVATVQTDYTHSGPAGTPQPTPQTEHFTIHSPKYTLTYNKQYFGGQEHDCHELEADIETFGRPNDDCECDLKSLANPPPAGVCSLLYKEYNHILDNRLYRSCLANEDPAKTAETIDLTDCRTKIDYARPPPIYKRETIVLQPDTGAPPVKHFALDVKDPTRDVFEACNLVKQCYSRFAKDRIDKACIEGTTCDALVTFGKGIGESPRPDETVIEIYAVARAWVALGFSISPEDEIMGEDYVVECVKEGAKLSLYNSWNIKQNQTNKFYKGNIRMRGDQGIRGNIRPVLNIFHEDRIYCKFYIKKTFTKTDPDLHKTEKYDLDKLHHYVIAFSNELPDYYGEERGNLKSHQFNGAQSEVGRKKVAAGQRLSPLPYQTRFLRLHALFMILGWLLFLTLSTFIARYYKETMVRTKLMKREFWYFFHVLTAVFGCVCIFISLVFETEAIRGWRNLFRSNFHTYSGILCVCLFVAVMLLGVWVKKRALTDKHIMNLVHSILGHLAYNLALFNMAFADRVAYGFLSCNFRTYIWIWFGVYYLLHCFMSYHYCWVDFILGRNTGKKRLDPISLVTQRGQLPPFLGNSDHSRASLRKSRKIHDLEAQRRSNTPSMAIEAPGRYIRICALVLFVIIAAVYTIWAIRKVVTYPRHCYNFKQLKYLEEKGFN